MVCKIVNPGSNYNNKMGTYIEVDLAAGAVPEHNAVLAARGIPMDQLNGPAVYLLLPV
jgi:hypothetical protein